ncbi:MAG: 2-isopropylmalate synthase [Acidiferrobacterales bacterium]
MIINPARKYRTFTPINLADRRWPSRTIDAPPIWCSVDLRDGNQALVQPMDGMRKLRMFELLVRLGFKEIEVGFPAASRTEFEFVRQLIEKKLIPDDVTIQVLTPARDALIRRTFEAVRGARRVIMHLYNSTSEVQRRVVFGLGQSGVVDIAVRGAVLCRELARGEPQTEWVFQYSPESFTGTELDFALEICQSVQAVWQPSPERKMIVNLPATVEMSTPNAYADQIEWFDRHISGRESITLSVHPHNDRGTAVAAAELALMAGAERVEGTLFGNGERTGNVDLVSLALNLFSQGIAPGLDFSDINEVIRCAEFCNRLPVHPRHPYAGELVFTAFSGSHQDAIRKGLAARCEDGIWEVPYLPIDPADLGRSYEPVIRVNSQSGKGGVAYLLERDYGMHLPRGLQLELGLRIKRLSDDTGAELGAADIWSVFRAEYIDAPGPFSFDGHSMGTAMKDNGRQLCFRLREQARAIEVRGCGNGPIEAFMDALMSRTDQRLELVDYHEHGRGAGAGATAAAFVGLQIAGNGGLIYGVGMHQNIVDAALRAIVSALNRAIGQGAAGIRR